MKHAMEEREEIIHIEISATVLSHHDTVNKTPYIKVAPMHNYHHQSV